MKKFRLLSGGILLSFLLFGAMVLPGAGAPEQKEGAVSSPEGERGKDVIQLYSVRERGWIMTRKVYKTADEWKRLLSPEAYHVTEEQGTERSFSGSYWNQHEEGVYRCIRCGNDLFVSETKFESKTGWPSFTKPVSEENIETRIDRSLFMKRVEVRCSRCGAHLGHVFKDGPKPTGLRYCINSAALKFGE